MALTIIPPAPNVPVGGICWSINHFISKYISDDYEFPLHYVGIH